MVAYYITNTPKKSDEIYSLMKSWLYLIHSAYTAKTWDLDLFIWIRVGPGFNLNLQLPWVYHSNIGDINALRSTIVISNPMLISTDTSSYRYCLNDINELQSNILTYNTVLILVDTSNSRSPHISLLV